MTLKECYCAVEGDYENVTERFGGEALVRKFIVKFLNDASFANLQKSMETGDYEEAFRAAHTLKGICQNLSLTKLYTSSSSLTEALRNGCGEGAAALLVQTEADYRQTVEAVETYRLDNGL